MGFLPDTTEFPDNGIAIDPDTCGCTDCLTHQAVHPRDTWMLEEAIRDGRVLINRTGHEVTLPNGFRMPDDTTWYPTGPRLRSQIHCSTCDCSTYPSN